MNSILFRVDGNQFLTIALLLCYGGISLINRITGMSINTIRCGIEELQQGDIYECNGPERAEGAGRPGNRYLKCRGPYQD